MIVYFAFCLSIEAFKFDRTQQTERISGSAGDVLEDDPVGRLKVFVYELPSKYNKKILQKDPRCLTHMFAAEIFMHRFLLSSPVRTLNPEEADWFYTPVYTTCDLTPNGLPLPFKSPRMMRSAIQLISSNWPYWNRTEGADHFFIVPHDFGACFHYQEEKAIERGILTLLQRATLVQTFGQRNHVCLKDDSITIPPYAPPQKMQTHLIPPSTPRSIFVYFRGLFYDVGNDPEGGYYARGARASVWENFKNNPLFDISTEHPSTYYEDMQRAVFCLCPLGWAPWSPRLVEAVIFGCIPVIIADDIVLPFADAIPWEDIGVFVAEKDVPKLDTILTSIPIDEILRKQRLLGNPSMKQAMLFPQPAQPRDAFHQILNGLARKLPHDKRVYLKPGEKILNWTAGPVGDLKPWFVQMSIDTQLEFDTYTNSDNLLNADVRKARKAELKEMKPLATRRKLSNSLLLGILSMLSGTDAVAVHFLEASGMDSEVDGEDGNNDKHNHSNQETEHGYDYIVEVDSNSGMEINSLEDQVMSITSPPPPQAFGTRYSMELLLRFYPLASDLRTLIGSSVFALLLIRTWWIGSSMAMAPSWWWMRPSGSFMVVERWSMELGASFLHGSGAKGDGARSLPLWWWDDGRRRRGAGGQRFGGMKGLNWV
ncbi:unnamed protein product [Fraxinus pennsylvanica]|uniref:Exostosin GT47 domain-containing protein n=1 Tax=Fraxinus pennsylvanica TaxID=56036 RepID=A0AAD2EEY1_9LAMI|nr:unnamed protein product [Fraxinus pennsylvanica]